MPVMQRRAQDTRSALLQAARQIFADVGYSEANVAEVVSRAGSSVGSMYHHFGGKADLFLALHDEHRARQEARADAAVQDTLAAGERNPARVFAAGARAFMQGAWEERDLAKLFLSGDGPPGFDAVMRAGFGDWVRRSGAMFGAAEGAEPNQAYPLVLTTVIATGAREVTQKPDEQAAMAFAEDLLALLDVIPAGPLPVSSEGRVSPG
jgi:AcrR family transcriptional regulator